jgi:transcriptional regulator with XRE-family HTH domain
MIFGERVKQARELRGFTQTKLAELLKVTQGRIAQIEGEFRDAADSVIAEIAYHTDLPLSYFSKAPVNRLTAGSLLFRARTSISKREVTQSLRDAEHVFGLAESMARDFQQRNRCVASSAHLKARAYGCWPFPLSRAATLSAAGPRWTAVRSPSSRYRLAVPATAWP